MSKPAKRHPWRKWFTKDWRADAPLRMCSYAARGLWADLLSLMHEAKYCGFLLIEGVSPTAKQLAGLLGGAEREVKALLAELATNNVYSVTGKPMPDDVKELLPPGMPDGVILSRRMVRDEAKAKRDRENGKGGGNPNLARGDKGGGSSTLPETSEGDKRGVNPPANPQKLEVKGKAPSGLSPTESEISSLGPARASPAGAPLRAGTTMAETLAQMAEARRRVAA